MTSLLFASFAAYACMYYNFFVYGVLVLITGFVDAIDGAVARLKHEESNVGNYLDAMCDRLSEIILLIPFIDYYPILAFSAVSGSLIFSYAKARFAMIKKTENNNWPQFGERAERLVYLGFGAILLNFFNELVFVYLLLFNLIIWLSFMQRIIFAKRLLS